MVGNRTFHLFYRWKGVIQNFIFQEEVFEAKDEAEVKEAIGKIVSAMRKGYNPWKYSFRVEATDGSYWVVQRREGDVENNLFTCTYYPRWNWEDKTVKMNRRELTKAIIELSQKGQDNELEH